MELKRNHGDVKRVLAQLEPFYFQFTHSNARVVCVAGSFNDWQPEAKPMVSMGESYWIGETVLSPGTYEYCVDGQWMPDPLAKETVANPFGGRNSLLKVPGFFTQVRYTEW